MRHFFLILVFALLGHFLQAQNPKVIHFPDLEERMSVENDTLYVVNFWATWCRPCVAELPYFDDLQAAYLGEKVKVLLVSLDFVEDYEESLLSFIDRKKPQSEIVLLDEPKYNQWLSKVSEAWTGAIPATIFLNHAAGIRHFHEGEFSKEELFQQVKKLYQSH